MITNSSSVISGLLSRVAELEDRFDIDITTGVNDTLVFRHYATSAASPNVITYTYTIVLAGQRYTTDEMLTAINAAIATQGSVQNAITTTMASSLAFRSYKVQRVQQNQLDSSKTVFSRGVRAAT